LFSPHWTAFLNILRALLILPAVQDFMSIEAAIFVDRLLITA
jgi:hypothetical protein